MCVMNKKILFGLCVMISISMVCISSCNKQIIDTTYEFNKAIITIGNETKEVEISSWTDYDDGDQIQIRTTDGTIYLGHSSNILLIYDED